MHAKLHTEESLRTAADLFVTFLYAASVHLVIAHFARLNPMTILPGLVVLFFIVFLFSDWLSRVRLPWLLPPLDKVGVGKQLTKSFLEIAGLFFLVIACLAYIERYISGTSSDTSRLAHWNGSSTALKPYIAFAVFLLVTFAWNLVMLLVMQRLKWFHVFRMGIDGTALDSEKVNVYAKRFWQFREKLKRWADRSEQAGDEGAFLNFALRQPGLIIEAFVRTFAQIGAMHIAWANLVAGTLILVGEFRYDGAPVGQGLRMDLNNMRWTSSVMKVFATSRWTSFNVIFLVASLLIVVLFTFLLRDQKPVVRVLKAMIFCVFVFLVAKVAFYLTVLTKPVLSAVALLAVVPAIFFYYASQCNKKKRLNGVILLFSGVVSTILLLRFYLVVEPKTLMFVIAFQQISVNAFLQYAASERGDSVDIIPPTAVIPKGALLQFKETVVGTTNKAVVWKATEGDISQTGLFTAPQKAAAIIVTVTLSEDDSQFAEASVTVIEHATSGTL